MNGFIVRARSHTDGLDYRPDDKPRLAILVSDRPDGPNYHPNSQCGCIVILFDLALRWERV